MICTEELKNESGIYLISNIINGKIYVGSAVNLRSRRNGHISKLNKNKHHSIALQRAWNKYGSENFSFTVLERVLDRSELIEREQYWMDILNVMDRNIGYNMSPTAGSNLGITHSQETNKKRVLNNPRIRQILQFDTNGKLLKEWFSVPEMQRETNIKKSTILSKLKNQTKLNDTYLIYKDEYSDELLKVILADTHQLHRKLKGRQTSTNAKKVNQYSKSGKFIQSFDAISQASEFVNIFKSQISKCCNGERKTAGGFVWSFVH